MLCLPEPFLCLWCQTYLVAELWTLVSRGDPDNSKASVTLRQGTRLGIEGEAAFSLACTAAAFSLFSSLPLPAPMSLRLTRGQALLEGAHLFAVLAPGQEASLGVTQRPKKRKKTQTTSCLPLFLAAWIRTRTSCIKRYEALCLVSFLFLFGASDYIWVG